MYNIFIKINQDKIRSDKSFNIAKNLNYDIYQRGSASMVNKFFGKKLLVVVLKLVRTAICQTSN